MKLTYRNTKDDGVFIYDIKDKKSALPKLIFGATLCITVILAALADIIFKVF